MCVYDRATNTNDTWGLTYKIVLRIHNKNLLTYKLGNVRMPKKFLIYKTCRAPVCVQLPFMNPKSTWKRVQVVQPVSRRLHTYIQP